MNAVKSIGGATLFLYLAGTVLFWAWDVIDETPAGRAPTLLEKLNGQHKTVRKLWGKLW